MIFTLLSAAATMAAVAKAQLAPSGSVSVTPHDMYSSSIGALGCKLNTNRIAYWPAMPGCDNLCIKLRYQDRELHVLHVDTSGGAYDISYDAWNYLGFGVDAQTQPWQGGGIQMDYEIVGMDQCADILAPAGGKLGLTAANSMNYVAACFGQPDSWVAKNYQLYNILNPVCTWGFDEECTVDLAAGQNQPTCPNILGLTAPLTSAPVYNIQYGTGALVLAQ